MIAREATSQNWKTIFFFLEWNIFNCQIKISNYIPCPWMTESWVLKKGKDKQKLPWTQGLLYLQIDLSESKIK